MSLCWFSNWVCCHFVASLVATHKEGSFLRKWGLFDMKIQYKVNTSKLEFWRAIYAFVSLKLQNKVIYLFEFRSFLPYVSVILRYQIQTDWTQTTCLGSLKTFKWKITAFTHFPLAADGSFSGYPMKFDSRTKGLRNIICNVMLLVIDMCYL